MKLSDLQRKEGVTVYAVIRERPHGRARLSRAQVLEAMRRLQDGETARSIAKGLSVSPKTVSNILHGRTWRPITAGALHRVDVLLGMFEPEPNSGCWLWTGCVNRKGYGYARLGGRKVLAHRLFLASVGADLSGMVVDHRCRNRSCVNPDHLRAVDTRTNTLENSVGVAAKNAARTHCKRGHALSGNNLLIWNRSTRSSGKMRVCRTCFYAARKAKRATRRDAAVRP